MLRTRSLLASVAVLAFAVPAQAQAGVDLVLSTAGVQLGVPCETFSQVPYFPWVSPGQPWLFQVYAEPQTPHFLLFGPPPTSSSSFAGVDGLLLIHAPVSVLLTGVTGPLDATSFCGQGHTNYPVHVPAGPSSGADFSLQVLAQSSTTGNWAFSRHHWVTYL